jgi:2-pyrone-4,6-dicarboxylate lactonase
MGEIQDCPPAAQTVPPRWTPSSLGWDCHAHVFGPDAQFPYQEPRRYTPEDHPVRRYLDNLDVLGLRYGVIVQPSVYGHDNDALIHALIHSDGRLTGVVCADAALVGDATLRYWNDVGVRGVRVWWDAAQSASTLATLQAAASRIGPLGWHVDVYCRQPDDMLDLATHVDEIDLPIMIEAMGTPSTQAGIGQDSFQALLALVAQRKVFVKLSHPYKIDRNGPPYALADQYAEALVRAGPAQLVWGSDWPHPLVPGPMPNDGGLLDLLFDWTRGDIETANAILSTNAHRFYLA